MSWSGRNGDRDRAATSWFGEDPRAAAGTGRASRPRLQSTGITRCQSRDRPGSRHWRRHALSQRGQGAITSALAMASGDPVECLIERRRSRPLPRWLNGPEQCTHQATCVCAMYAWSAATSGGDGASVLVVSDVGDIQRARVFIGFECRTGNAVERLRTLCAGARARADCRFLHYQARVYILGHRPEGLPRCKKQRGGSLLRSTPP